MNNSESKTSGPFGNTYEYKSFYFDNPIVSQRVFDILLPEKITQDTALFFTHGGGWHAGSRINYHQIMRAFNKLGYVCASTDYRLGSDSVDILTQIEDVRYGYLLFLQYLRDNDRPLKVFTLGSSAGAHLTALLSYAGPGDCGENTSDVPNVEWVAPVGMATQATPMKFEPWEDIFPHIWSTMQKIVGVPYEGNQELYEKVAPINHISSETCPTFLLEADNEHMFLLEHNLPAIEKLNSLDVLAKYKVYTNAEHGFFYDVIRRQQKEAFNDILEFIQEIENR